MAWDGGGSLAEQFASARATVVRMFPSLPRPGRTYQGFVKAMKVWGTLLRERLAAHLRDQMRRMDSCWTVMDIPAFAVDGSRVECPRTAANQKHLRCAGRRKTAPQLSLTTIYHMGSGCPWDYRIGPGVENERTHLRAMLAALPEGATIVADAGFTGHDLLREILQSNRHVLFRVGSNVRLLQKLGYARVEDDSTVYLWPEAAQAKDKEPLVLRLMVLPGRHPVYLVTDRLCEESLSLEQAGVLYRMRWGVEVFYRSLKQTLHQRTMRSRSPGQARRELSWAVTGLWVLSLAGAQAVVARGKTPGNLSIATARKLVRQAMAGRCRPRADLRKQLATALKDSYVRTGSKAARNWPHKKNERHAGAPKFQVAEPWQVQHAKELLERNSAA